LCLRGKVADRPHARTQMSSSHIHTAHIVLWIVSPTKKKKTKKKHTHTHTKVLTCTYTLPGTRSDKHTKSLTKHQRIDKWIPDHFKAFVTPEFRASLNYYNLLSLLKAFTF